MFVGRKQEINSIVDEIYKSEGSVVLLVGNYGMGKTAILNRLEEIAGSIPTLKCSTVRCEITGTDHVDSIMALILDNLIEAAKVTEGSLASTPRRAKQWKSFLSVFPGIKQLSDLRDSLKYNPTTNIRDQFLERMQLVSNLMDEQQRLILLIDPEKYLLPASDQSWTIIATNLPPKIKLIFAQRSDDVLAQSMLFLGCRNVVRIPKVALGSLGDEDIDLLIKEYQPKTRYTYEQIHTSILRYNNHPYATIAALNLIKDGVLIEELPNDPTPTKIVEEQWNRVSRKGGNAIKLLEVYAAIEIPIPDDIVVSLADINRQAFMSLISDEYLSSLFREEDPLCQNK
jgi:hypothetical protein